MTAGAEAGGQGEMAMSYKNYGEIFDRRPRPWPGDAAFARGCVRVFVKEGWREGTVAFVRDRLVRRVAAAVWRMREDRRSLGLDGGRGTQESDWLAAEAAVDAMAEEHERSLRAT